MLTCAALWSIGGIFIKQVPWNSLVISGARSFLAGTVVLIYMLATRQKIIINRRSISAGIMMCMMFVTFVGANKLTTAANAIVLQFTAPVFILVLSAVFLHKRFLKSDVFAVLLTIIGIALFFFDNLTAGRLVGNLVAIAAGISQAITYMIIGEAEGEERMSCLLLGQFMTAIVGIPFALTTEVTLAAKPVICILILGIFQLGIPYLLYVKSTKYCPPLACSLLGAVEPLLNPVWVFIFDGEAPGAFALIGGVIVIATITVWCIYGEKNAKQNRTA
jgi:drug/metabolite transporter (DMT)-like permease